MIAKNQTSRALCSSWEMNWEVSPGILEHLGWTYIFGCYIESHFFVSILPRSAAFLRQRAKTKIVQMCLKTLVFCSIPLCSIYSRCYWTRERPVCMSPNCLWSAIAAPDWKTQGAVYGCGEVLTIGPTHPHYRLVTYLRLIRVPQRHI